MIFVKLCLKEDWFSRKEAGTTEFQIRTGRLKADQAICSKSELKIRKDLLYQNGVKRTRADDQD